MSEISFAGKTAIVTGAGRGLGRSHALEFARRGAAVVVNEIRDGLAEKVTEEITSAAGKQWPSTRPWPPLRDPNTWST